MPDGNRLSVLSVTVKRISTAANVQASHRPVGSAPSTIAMRRQRYPDALSDGDFDLDIAPRLSPIQGNNNPINVIAQYRPLGVSKNDDVDFPDCGEGGGGSRLRAANSRTAMICSRVR